MELDDAPEEDQSSETTSDDDDAVSDPNTINRALSSFANARECLIRGFRTSYNVIRDSPMDNLVLLGCKDMITKVFGMCTLGLEDPRSVRRTDLLTRLIRAIGTERAEKKDQQRKKGHSPRPRTVEEHTYLDNLETEKEHIFDLMLGVAQEVAQEKKLQSDEDNHPVEDVSVGDNPVESSSGQIKVPKWDDLTAPQQAAVEDVVNVIGQPIARVIPLLAHNHWENIAAVAAYYNEEEESTADLEEDELIQDREFIESSKTTQPPLTRRWMANPTVAGPSGSQGQAELSAEEEAAELEAARKRFYHLLSQSDEEYWKDRSKKEESKKRHRRRAIKVRRDDDKSDVVKKAFDYPTCANSTKGKRRPSQDDDGFGSPPKKLKEDGNSTALAVNTAAETASTAHMLQAAGGSEAGPADFEKDDFMIYEQSEERIDFRDELESLLSLELADQETCMHYLLRHNGDMERTIMDLQVLQQRGELHGEEDDASPRGSPMEAVVAADQNGLGEPNNHVFVNSTVESMQTESSADTEASPPSPTEVDAECLEQLLAMGFRDEPRTWKMMKLCNHDVERIVEELLEPDGEYNTSSEIPDKKQPKKFERTNTFKPMTTTSALEPEPRFEGKGKGKAVMMEQVEKNDKHDGHVPGSPASTTTRRIPCVKKIRLEGHKAMCSTPPETKPTNVAPEYPPMFTMHSPPLDPHLNRLASLLTRCETTAVDVPYPSAPPSEDAPVASSSPTAAAETVDAIFVDERTARLQDEALAGMRAQRRRRGDAPSNKQHKMQLDAKKKHTLVPFGEKNK
ncbi:hypothetical protein ACEQ8H_004914 [Pleosporales sp. CAS-2024a]